MTARKIRERGFRIWGNLRRPRRSSAPVTTLVSSKPSAHGAEFLWLNLVQHAHLTGLSIRVLCLTKVLLCQAVDVIVGTLLRDIDDLATNFEIAVGIVGI